MKNRIQYFLLGLLVVFVIAAATPISFLKLMSDADGNQHSITNLASITVDEIQGDATNQFAVSGGTGISTNDGTGTNNIFTGPILDSVRSAGITNLTLLGNADANDFSINNALSISGSDAHSLDIVADDFVNIAVWRNTNANSINLAAGAEGDIVLLAGANGGGVGGTIWLRPGATDGGTAGTNEIGYDYGVNGLTRNHFVGTNYFDHPLAVGTNSAGTNIIKAVGWVDVTGGYTVNGEPITATSVATVTNLSSTNIIYPNFTFSGPTNSLLLNNTYQLYTADGDCAITNVSGTSATASTWATLIVSNSTDSAITLRISVPSARKIGTIATNSLVIGAGKLGITPVLSYGQSFTQYWNFVEP